LKDIVEIDFDFILFYVRLSLFKTLYRQWKTGPK